MEAAPKRPSTPQAVSRGLNQAATSPKPTMTEARQSLYTVSLVLSKRIASTISGGELVEAIYSPGEERVGESPAWEHNSVSPQSPRQYEKNETSQGLRRTASLEVSPGSSTLRERRSPGATDLPNIPMVHSAIYAKVYSPTKRTWRHVEFGHVTGSDPATTRPRREATITNRDEGDWPSGKGSREADSPTRDCWQNIDDSAVNRLTKNSTSQWARDSIEAGSPTVTQFKTINRLEDYPSSPETQWQTNNNRSTESDWQGEDHTTEPMSLQKSRWQKDSNYDTTGSHNVSQQQRENYSSQHTSWQNKDDTLITESSPKSPRHSTPHSAGTRTPPRTTWHNTPLSILSTSPPRIPGYSQPSSVATKSLPESPWLNKPSIIIATSPPGISWLNKSSNIISTSPTGSSWHNKSGSTKVSSPGSAWHNKPSCIVATSLPTSSWPSKSSGKTSVFPPETRGHHKSRSTQNTAIKSCGPDTASNIIATSPTEHHGHNTTSSTMWSTLPGSPGFNKSRTTETSPPKSPEHNTPKGTMETSPPESPRHTAPNTAGEPSPPESPGRNTPKRAMEIRPGSPGHNTLSGNIKTPLKIPQHKRTSNIIDTSLIECQRHNTDSSEMDTSPPGNPGHNNTKRTKETSPLGSPGHSETRPAETLPPGSPGSNETRTAETLPPGSPGSNETRTTETLPAGSPGYNTLGKVIEISPTASAGHNIPKVETDTSPTKSLKHNKPSSILIKPLTKHPRKSAPFIIMYTSVTDNLKPIIDSRKTDNSPPRSPGHNQHRNEMIKSLQEYSEHDTTESLMDALPPECSGHNPLHSGRNKLPQNCPEQNKTDGITDPLPPESSENTVHNSIIEAMPPAKPGHEVVSNKVTTLPSETSEQNEPSCLKTKSLQEPTWQDEVHSLGTKSSMSHSSTCSTTAEPQSNGQDVFDGIRTTFNSNCENPNESCSAVSKSLPKPMTQNAASRTLIELAPKGTNQSLSRGTKTEVSPNINSQDETSRAVQEFLPNSINENETSSNVKESDSNHQISVNWAATEPLGGQNDNQVESTSGVPNSVSKSTFKIEDSIKECNLPVKIPGPEQDGLPINTPVTGNRSQNEIDSPNAESPKENLAFKVHNDIAAVTLEQEIGETPNKLTNGDSQSQHSKVENETILFGETSMDNIGDESAPTLKIYVTDYEGVVTSSEQSSRNNLESMDTMLPLDRNFQGAEGGPGMSSTKHMHTSTMTHLPPLEGTTLPHSMVGEESDVAVDMDSWVDIVRKLETPEIMKHPRVVKLPRTSALSVYATLPPITEDGGSPRSPEPLPVFSDTENRLSSPVDEEEEEEMEGFEPSSDVDSGVASTQDSKEMPATGEKPKPVYSWENIVSRSKDLENLSPLEMMRRHLGDDSNQASRTTGYRATLDQNKPQRQSCSTDTLLLSERLEKKATSSEEKPYSRLDSLLFISYKISEHAPYGGMKTKESLKNGLTTLQVPLVPSSDVKSHSSPDEPLGENTDPEEDASALSPPPLPTSPPDSLPPLPQHLPTPTPRTVPPLPQHLPTPTPRSVSTLPQHLPTPTPSTVPPLPQTLPTPTPSSAPPLPQHLPTPAPRTVPPLPQTLPTPTPSSAPPLPQNLPTPTPTSVPPPPQHLPTPTPTSVPPLPPHLPTPTPTRVPALPQHLPNPTPSSAPPLPQHLPTPTQSSVPPLPQHLPTPTSSNAPPLPQHLPTPTLSSAPPLPQGLPTPASTSVPPLPQHLPTPASTSVPRLPQHLPSPTQSSVPPLPKHLPAPTPSSVPPLPKHLPAPTPGSVPPLPQHLPKTPHTKTSSSGVPSHSMENKQSKVQPQAELRAFPDDWQHEERERGKLNPRPGKMVIFTEPGLQGEQHEIWGDIYDATVLELPSAISIRVIRGGWVMYEKPRYQGRKIVLEEGDTELTDPWGNQDEDSEAEEEAMTPVRIGSLRHVVRDYSVPAISLFAEENGEGKKLKFLDASHDARMFGQPLKTSSIIVHSGLWVVYREPFFEGQPSILEPGGYPNMKAWGGEEPFVCSLQPIQIGCPTVEKPYEPKIIMFESPDFEDHSWEINQDFLDLKSMQDAEGTPVSTVGSLRVLGGCWVGYEKEGFRGQQYLLEEGEYMDWKDWGGISAELTSIRLIRTDFSEPALVLYAEPDFEDGPSLEICVALPDVELEGYGPSTQSILVHSGVWVAYENVDYSGAQYILEKGTYHCFQDWGASNSRICSLLPVRQVGDPSLHYESKIQLFTEAGFHGDDLIYEEESFTLPEGFNPQSCRVHGGSWILYENVDFSGEQYVLSEGEYPSPTAMGCMSQTVLRSLMQVPIHFSEPSISLHGLESFEGKEIELTGEVRSLQAEGFNNHVLSVRVRGGIWVLYEHCDYRGRQWLLDSTEITNWPQYSGLQHIGSLCPIQQRRVYFHVRNRALQQFLCINEDTEDMKAARVLVSEPSDQARLIWYYEEGRIKNHVAPDMSLQLIGSAQNGAKVVLWSQNRIPYQTWRIDSNGHICNQMFDGMILDVKGGQVYDRDNAVLWDVAEERPTQLWTIEVL
ncbi:beta/gamma crystallin domain-containing protein 2 isoform X2 [Lissotriton helveticus]